MQAFLTQCRQHFLFVGIFSFGINLLALVMPIYMLQIYDRVLSSRSEETLVVLTVITLGLMLSMMALEMVRTRVLLGVGRSLDEAVSPRVIAQLLTDSAQAKQANRSASVRDVQQVQAFLGGNGVVAFFDAPWTPLFIALLFILHPWLGWGAVLSAGLLFVLAVMNERLSRGALETAAHENRRTLRFIETALRSAETVTGLGMTDRIVTRWTRLNNQTALAQQTAGRIASALLALTKFLRMGLQVAMVATGAYLAIKQEITSGVIMASTLILARALAPVEMIVGSWRGWVEARAGYRRLDQLLAGGGDDKPQLNLPKPVGRLTVERLVFAPRGPEHAILRGVSFELEPGESLGVIGPSAAGKSTLARLLSGVWKAHSGAVRLDGADITEWPARTRGQVLGYLPQSVDLLPGTIAENIARYDEEADEAVVAAAQRAHVHDLILRLPNGYDTEIDERVSALSAGQCQRIALARALYGDPALVILDEPNAALDSEGEDALAKILAGLKAAKVTTIVIAHKPSVLAQVDKLLVLRNGGVELFGPTREVLQRVTTRGTPPVTLVHPAPGHSE